MMTSYMTIGIYTSENTPYRNDRKYKVERENQMLMQHLFVMLDFEWHQWLFKTGLCQNPNIFSNLAYINLLYSITVTNNFLQHLK